MSSIELNDYLFSPFLTHPLIDFETVITECVCQMFGLIKSVTNFVSRVKERDRIFSIVVVNMPFYIGMNCNMILGCTHF